MSFRSYATGRPVLGEASAMEHREAPRPQPAAELFEMLSRERRQLPAMPSWLAEAIIAKLDDLQACDLGVGPDLCQRLPPSATVGYMEVGQTSEMTICLFALKKGASIPLHDHPDMHVFGRLLFGRMLATSFDLEPPPPAFPPPEGSVLSAEEQPPPRQLARVYASEVYGPEPRTYWLSPRAGNLHYLEALEDCCFFDIVTPPYDAALGRDCTYYYAHIDLELASKGEFCPIQVYQPRGFYTHPLPYGGPRPSWFKAGAKAFTAADGE